MKFIVKNINIGDSAPYGPYQAVVTPSMILLVGKELDLQPEAINGWYFGGEFHWHESWLELTVDVALALVLPLPEDREESPHFVGEMEAYVGKVIQVKFHRPYGYYEGAGYNWNPKWLKIFVPTEDGCKPKEVLCQPLSV